MRWRATTSGASAASQRVITWARGSESASSAPTMPAATISAAHESSSVSTADSSGEPGHSQYARLSPAQLTTARPASSTAAT